MKVTVLVPMTFSAKHEYTAPVSLSMGLSIAYISSSLEVVRATSVPFREMMMRLAIGMPVAEHVIL